MSRDLTTNLITEITSAAFKPFYAIKADLATTTLALWTGIGDLSISGVTYSGVGTFLSIGEVKETAQISANGLDISLSGIPSDLLSLALTEQYQGRELELFFGITDLTDIFLLRESGDFLLLESEGRIILQDAEAPASMFKGYIDQMVIEEGADTSTITVSVESKLIDLERARTLRYTDESQKARFPNDKGFQYVNDLQDKKFNWGRS